MPLYYYIAKTKDAKTIKEVSDVGSKDELIGRLKSKDLFIISIEEIGKKKKKPSGGKFLSVRKMGRHRGIKGFDMCSFARYLSTTLSAGITLLRSLELISIQTDSLTLADTLKKISDDVKSGLSLNEAVQKYPNIFSSLWTGIIEVGESSGNLPFVLEKLADYLEMRLGFERKVKSALIYPTMVSIFGGIAVAIFFKFILPRFTVIFKEFNIKLPLLTQLLFNISNFFNKNFLLVMVSVVFLGVGFWRFKDSPFFKDFMDRVALALPVISRLTLTSALERFSSTMYILLESGVPIVYSLEVVSKSVGNSVMEKSLTYARENVRKGRSLSSELAKIELFPVLISEIASIGEEAGNLPQMFQRVSVHYQKELSTKLERLVALFEPLLIFLLGITIGAIVIALFMPIFKLVTLGGGGV